MNAARVIRDARRRARLTQSELAARVGTSQATLSAYENGRKQPSLDTLSRLLAAAGARLTIEPARTPVIKPSPAAHRRAARDLADALALAEALPARPAKTLRFPRLDSRSRRAA